MSDFREVDMAQLRTWPMEDRGWYVYRFWDRDGECLYVGSTGWLRKRAQWPMVLIGSVDICEYPDRGEMRAAERYWLIRLAPPFNQSRPRGTIEDWQQSYPDYANRICN